MTNKAGGFLLASLLAAVTSPMTYDEGAARRRAMMADKTGSGPSTHNEARARRKAERQARKKSRRK